MRKRSEVLGALALAVACAMLLGPILFGPARAQDEGSSESERATVVEIQITGNDHVGSQRILEALPFSRGEEIALPDELARAEARLRETGLFQEVSSDYRHVKGGVVVLLEVLENPVVQEIEISGNRDWNEERRITIPLVGLSFRWPFADYLVSPDRLHEILKEQGVETGEVLNTVKLRKALGIDQNGGCLQNPPQPSICGEYLKQGYFLVSIGNVEVGETVRIEIVEGVIESIEIQGLEEGPLRERAFRLLSAIPTDRPVKRQTLQEAVQELAQSIYFRPIDPEDIRFSSGSAPDRVVLVLDLEERQLIEQPASIERVDFVGVSAFPEAELVSRLRLPEGPVSNYQLLAALEEVYDLYRSEGYTLAKFSDAQLSDGVMTLQVDEGRIAEIEVRQNGYATARWTQAGLEELPLQMETAEPEEAREGSPGGLGETIQQVTAFLGELLGTAAPGGRPRTHPEIVANALTFGPQDLVNRYRLNESYRELLNLGYFREVDFNFEPLPSGEVRLIVEVAEKEKLGSLNGGFSVSKEGLVGSLSVSGKNLYGMGQDVSLGFNRALLGKSVVNWNLDYQGRMLIEGTDYLSLKLFNKATRERFPRPHLLTRLGAEAGLALPAGEAQAVFGLRHERVTKDFSDEKPQVEQVNVASLTVNEDDRNNPVFATRGGVRSLTLERAGLFGLGSPFTKLQATLIRHFPTAEDQNVALRLVGGFGVDLPSQEAFALGGADTLRGVGSVHAPSVGFANLEYRVQLLPGSVSVALFADVGSAYPFDRLLKSVGMEGRVTVPYVGPVRLALAWPITDRVETLRAVFGFGTPF